MNFSFKQRKLYVLAAVLLAAVVVVCGVWNVWSKPAEPAGSVQPENAETLLEGAEGQEGQPTTDAVLPSEETVNTVVYYQDNYGYLVPVMRTVPAEEGIAKATLNLMVQSPYNDMEAARLGLRTVLPENTEVDLDISEGMATVDLGDQIMKMADADQEANMVSAIVQTLTEFPTVETVKFLLNGEEVSELTHGTSVAGELKRNALNLESAPNDLEPQDAQTIRLYFPGESNSLIVPVTRMVYGANDINTAVLELAKGPSAASPLDSALPSGCGLIGVTVDGDKAIINFSQEFIQIAEESDGGRMALKALVLTCTQFEGVNQVEVQVEGEKYDPGESTLAVPTFVNEAGAIQEEVIRTQAAMLLDMD